MNLVRDYPKISNDNRKRVLFFVCIGGGLGPILSFALFALLLVSTLGLSPPKFVPHFPTVLAFGYTTSAIIAIGIWSLYYFWGVVSYWFVIVFAAAAPVIVLMFSAIQRQGLHNVSFESLIVYSIIIAVFQSLPIASLFWWLSGLVSLGWANDR